MHHEARLERLLINAECCNKSGEQRALHPLIVRDEREPVVNFIPNVSENYILIVTQSKVDLKRSVQYG
mgnify:CR=1 FL=1